MHFFAPVVVGPAWAPATIVCAGKRMIVTAVDVIDVDGTVSRPAPR
jgi:hypothetical protein